MPMLRLLFICLLLAAPARAWEFSPVPICTLFHETDALRLIVTYDAAVPEYAIALTLKSGRWPDSPRFSIVFEGARGLTIGTDRHRLSPDAQTLTVTDRGFGNVLNGLQFNEMATAIAEEQRVTVPLQGAEPAVQAFRACPAPGLS